MRLISCYIENFGKLHQFSHEFQTGLNIIEEENGWGKTTFAAFIKAMFFGLEYRLGKIITDRKRYMPWNGNKFGGNLVFETGGKQYRIERFFGKRDKDDSFMLYDLTTNTQSQDFTENIGQEIWKVDRDSYEKTAFITLNEMELVNDIISSKLGNIDQQEADLEKSTVAVGVLDKMALEIKPKRGKGGLLGTKQQEVTDLKSEWKDCRDSLKEIRDKEGWIKEEEGKLKHLNEKIQAIDNEQSKIGLFEKKKHYQTILDDYKVKKEELQVVKNFFKGNVLSKEEIDKLDTENNVYIEKKQIALSKKLFEEEKEELEGLSLQFKDGLPGEEEMERCGRDITEYSAVRERVKSYQVSDETRSYLHSLSLKYGEVVADPSLVDKYIEDYQQVQGLEKEAQDLKTKLEMLDKDAAIKKQEVPQKKVSPKLIAGIGLVLLGLLIATQIVVVGVVVAVAGLVLVLVSLLLGKKSSQEVSDLVDDIQKERESYVRNLNEIRHRIDKTSSAYTIFLEKIGEQSNNISLALSTAKAECREYQRLKRDMQGQEQKATEAKEKAAAKEAEIQAFLGKFYAMNSLQDKEAILADLRKRSERFKRLTEKQNDYQQAMDIMKEKAAYVTPILEFYYGVVPDSAKNGIAQIREQRTKLEEKQGAFRKAEGSKIEFEGQNNIQEFQDLTLPSGTDVTMKADKEQYMEQKVKIIEIISNYKKDIDTLSIKADKLEDIDAKILDCSQEIEELQKQWDLLNLTRQCLENAKDNLAAKYMEGMSAAFDKYIHKLDSKKDDNYHIDIRLNVNLEQDGERHDSDGLSKGLKDLVQICLRMALVEAVYKEVDKPILVLDDPFVNLDKERLNNAVALLQVISEEYQVVYFICHESRGITQ